MFFFNYIYIIVLLVSSLLFWTVVREEYKTRFIIAASFICLMTIQIWFTLFLVILIAMTFYAAKLIQNRERSFQILILSIVILAFLMLFFKYSGRVSNDLFPDNVIFKNYIVPLGISYLIFKLIAFLFDVYRENIENPNIEELFAFIFFIPMYPAGPIERYQNFADHRKKNFDTSFYLQGLGRIILGYFKKIVFVNFILHKVLFGKMYPVITGSKVSMELSATFILSFLVLSLIYAYLDLSAYADIAIGYGQLFGYKICENMNYPIFQKNLSDYWNCWHISLSHWCRNNVYFPVLGKYRNTTLALFASFIVMGLWHNVTMNWILWGMWHASGITVLSRWNRFKQKHKKLKKIVPSRLGYVLGMMTTILYSGLGFSFIMMDKTIYSLKLFLAMFI